MNEGQNNGTAKAKILIVEDDEHVAMMMADLLTHADCEAEIAPTAKRGFELAEGNDFDLITLDVDLPDANGFEICSRLKSHPRSRDTSVVFISGRSHEADQQRAFALSAVDYITKPFDALNFARRILSHVKTKSGSGAFPTTEGAAA